MTPTEGPSLPLDLDALGAALQKARDVLPKDQMPFTSAVLKAALDAGDALLAAHREERAKYDTLMAEHLRVRNATGEPFSLRLG